MQLCNRFIFTLLAVNTYQLVTADQEARYAVERVV